LSLLVGWVYLLFCPPEKLWERKEKNKEKRNDERIGGVGYYVNETLVSSFSLPTATTNPKATAEPSQKDSGYQKSLSVPCGTHDGRTAV
jgi:hypothetical protein